MDSSHIKPSWQSTQWTYQQSGVPHPPCVLLSHTLPRLNCAITALGLDAEYQWFQASTITTFGCSSVASLWLTFKIFLLDCASTIAKVCFCFATCSKHESSTYGWRRLMTCLRDSPGTHGTIRHPSKRRSQIVTNILLTPSHAVWDAMTRQECCCGEVWKGL